LKKIFTTSKTTPRKCEREDRAKYILSRHCLWCPVWASPIGQFVDLTALLRAKNTNQEKCTQLRYYPTLTSRILCFFYSIATSPKNTMDHLLI